MKLSVDREEDLIESLAEHLHGWGLAVPAIALLEAHKPLSFIASQALLALQPFLSMFVDDSLLGDYALLLEDSGGLERIVSRLEQMQGESKALE
jgi:hypothetical protein